MFLAAGLGATSASEWTRNNKTGKEGVARSEPAGIAAVVVVVVVVAASVASTFTSLLNRSLIRSSSGSVPVAVSSPALPLPAAVAAAAATATLAGLP